MKKKYIIAVVLLLILSCSSNNKAELGNIVSSINGQPVIPYTANKLYIVPFTNQTGIPGYEEKIKQRITEKIITGGRLAIAPQQADSDVTLTGTIQSFQVQPIVIDSAGIIKKKRLLIIAVISLINARTGNYIFRNITVQAFKEFSDIEAPVTPINIVKDDVEQVLASRIALQVETGWYTSLKTEVEKGRK
ncbi:MAG: LPS assembly lipoprotein LptE [Spirochaetota bacterium]